MCEYFIKSSADFSFFLQIMLTLVVKYQIVLILLASEIACRRYLCGYKVEERMVI